MPRLRVDITHLLWKWASCHIEHMAIWRSNAHLLCLPYTQKETGFTHTLAHCAPFGKCHSETLFSTRTVQYTKYVENVECLWNMSVQLTVCDRNAIIKLSTSPRAPVIIPTETCRSLDMGRQWSVNWNAMAFIVSVFNINSCRTGHCLWPVGWCCTHTMATVSLWPCPKTWAICFARLFWNKLTTENLYCLIDDSTGWETWYNNQPLWSRWSVQTHSNG